MTTYVNAINAALLSCLSSVQKPVVFGQNIAAGSRIGGLTAGLDELSEAQVINTPNCENTLTAMTFGVALTGRPTCFILKQQDFLMLGVDHLVNTFNALRNRTLKAPCVFLMVVVDSGWEGPQSGMNNVSSLSDLTGIPAYFASGLEETPLAFEAAFGGGPAFLCVSQAMFKREIGNSKIFKLEQMGPGFNIYSISKERKLSGAALVAMGLSGLQLSNETNLIPSQITHVVKAFAYPLDFRALLQVLPKSVKEIVITTDEKRFSHPLASLANQTLEVDLHRVTFLMRQRARAWTVPSPEPSVILNY